MVITCNKGPWLESNQGLGGCTLTNQLPGLLDLCQARRKVETHNAVITSSCLIKYKSLKSTAVIFGWNETIRTLSPPVSCFHLHWRW